MDNGGVWLMATGVIVSQHVFYSQQVKSVEALEEPASERCVGRLVITACLWPTLQLIVRVAAGGNLMR